MNLNELRRKRGNIIEECRKMNDKAEQEGRAFTVEEQTEYDKRFNDATDLFTRIKREEELQDAERSANSGTGRRVDPENPESRDIHNSDEKRYRDVLRPLMSKFFSRSMREMKTEEQRALQSDLAVSGGYLTAPMQWVRELIKAVDNQTFIRKLAMVHTLTESDSMGAPSLDNDPADPAWTGEITTASEDSTMSFGKRELKTHPLKKLLKVSNKLLRLSPDAESLVRDRLAYKIGVTEENAFLNGTGAGQPLGVFTASNDGISTGRDVSTSNEATAIAADNLKECKYTLKGQYHQRAQWIAHRDWVKRVSLLKDSEGQYMWQPGLQMNAPDRLLGFPVNMSEYAPNTFTTGLYVAVLGDFMAGYWIADALSMVIQRLDELYAATSQTGFIVEAHADGMPVLEEAFVRSKMG